RSPDGLPASSKNMSAPSSSLLRGPVGKGTRSQFHIQALVALWIYTKLPELLLPDLLARRKAADVLFLAKLLNGLLDCPSLLAQVDIRIPSATRSRDLFGRRHSRRDYDFHGPLARMMRLGNNFCHLVDLFHDSASTIRGRVLASLRDPE
ncbi:Scm-like protein with four mbt domains, partial [Homalodisca vitripennis]